MYLVTIRLSFLGVLSILLFSSSMFVYQFPLLPNLSRDMKGRRTHFFSLDPPTGKVKDPKYHWKKQNKEVESVSDFNLRKFY